MTTTEAGVHRRPLLASTALFLAGCNSQEPRDGVADTPTDASTPTDTPTPTETPTPASGGWSVRFAYDGEWQGSVTVTTAEGDSTQAFDARDTKRVDIEAQLGVETRAVQEVVVQAQKLGNDEESLTVTIRKDGDVVAESSTDEPRGQVMVSHHEGPGTDDGETPTGTDTETATETPTPASGGWSVRFAYDGEWQGSITVTTVEGDSIQAFDGRGTKLIDIETQLGVETQAVQELVVQAQKLTNDDQPLTVTIRKDGDVVAESSTDEPRGQVMVSHYE